MTIFEVGSRKHLCNKQSSSCTCPKGARVRPTSRAYSDADPGLVCPTAAAAAIVAAVVAAAVVVAAATSAAADDFWFLNPFRTPVPFWGQTTYN